MKALCIDSSNKPSKIPDNEWVIEGQIYTITKVVRMGFQDNKYGVLLKEVQLSSSSFPYELYDMIRFIPLGFLESYAQEEETETEKADLELI